MMIRRLAVALAVAGLFAASAARAHDAERQAELIDELLRLNSEDIPERIIVKQIQAWCFRFELDGDDIIELHTLGVSDDIIEALIDTAFEELECEDDDYEYVWYRGAYSPWWYVPYTWGFYWGSPWPVHYVSHHYYYPYWYYPCDYYGYGHYDGYYGWHGSDYYVAYNPRKRLPTPRRRGSYRVVDNVPAVGVQTGTHGATERPPRGRGTVVVPRQRESGRVDVPRSPTMTAQTGANAAAATAPRERSERPRLTPAERVQTREAIPARPAARPRSRPQLSPAQPGRQAEPRTSVGSRTKRTPQAAPARPAKRSVAGRTSRTIRRAAPSRPAGRTHAAPTSRRPANVAPSRPAKRLHVGKKSRPSRSSSSVSRPSRSSRSRSAVSRPSRSSRARASMSRPSRSGSRGATARGRVSSGSRGGRKR